MGRYLFLLQQEDFVGTTSSRWPFYSYLVLLVVMEKLEWKKVIQCIGVLYQDNEFRSGVFDWFNRLIDWLKSPIYWSQNSGRVVGDQILISLNNMKVNLYILCSVCFLYIFFLVGIPSLSLSVKIKLP